MPIVRLLLAVMLATSILACRTPLEVPPLSLPEPEPVEPERLARSDPGELPRLAPLRLEHTEVSVAVIGGHARVRVRQRFHNADARMLGGVYQGRLPELSQIDRLQIVIGPRRIESGVQRRKPGWPDKERPAAGQLRHAVERIPPGGSVEVELEYLQALTQDDGEFEFVFPLALGEGEVSLDLEVEAGVAIEQWTAPTHAIEALTTERGFTARLAHSHDAHGRDFVIRWTPTSATARAVLYRGGEKGYFTLLVHTPSLDRDQPREIVFVIDNSSSMENSKRTVKSRMTESLTRLRPSDSFNVLTFEGSATRLFSRSQPATAWNLAAAERFVDKIRFGGAAQTHDAVELLHAEIGSGEQRFVVFMTDGSLANEDPLVRAAAELVARADVVGARAQVLGLGLGARNERLHRLSAAGNSEPITHDCAEYYWADTTIPRLFRRLDRPSFSRLEIDWAGLAVEELHEQDPALFVGDGRAWLGCYRGAPSGTPVVRARLFGATQPIEISIELVDGDERLLSTLWAREQIARLIRAWDRSELQAPAAREQIIRLGLEHRLETPMTSLVLVDNSPGTLESVTLAESTLVIDDFLSFGPSYICTLVGPSRVQYVDESEDPNKMLPLGHAAWAPDSVMRIAKLEASAGVELRAVRRSLRERAVEFEACHELHRPRALERRLRHRLHFDASGRLLAVEPLEGSLGEAGGACLGAVFRRVSWQGLPSERSVVEVELRLRMRSPSSWD